MLGVLALLSSLVLPAVAQEEFSLTVAPTVGLAETDTVSVTLAGTPSGEGLYVRQCIAPVGEERPTVCDGTGSWATLPAGLPGTPDGSLQPSQGTFDFPVAQAFGDVDCTVVQCGIFTRRDHNDPGDTSLDRWVPITFAAGVPGGARAVERVQGSDRFTTAAVASGSSPESASSSNSSSGSPSAARARSARRRMPCEQWATRRSAAPANPTRARAASTSSTPRPRNVATRVSSSRIVRPGCSAGSCAT